MSERDEVLAAAAQRQFPALIGPLRDRARELGYALAVHGSLERDIDLIAVAWIEEAVLPEVLVDALIPVAQEVTGIGCLSPRMVSDGPDSKPHGRRAWSILLGGGSYLDLSVIGPCPR